MKKSISEFFKSFTKADWGKLSAFVLINIGFCVSFGFIRLFVVMLIGDFFPPRYLGGSIFHVRTAHPLAYRTANIILMLFLQLWTGALMKKLQLWLVSLPIQFVLCFFALYLLIPGALLLAAQLVGQVLIAQIPAVFIGLYIRKLCARTKTPKPWWAN